MDEQEENPRRKAFIAWYKAHYDEGSEGRAKFMADTGRNGEPPLTKGRVSHLFDPKQPFGEIAAKNLALRLGEDEGLFLSPLSRRAYEAALMLDRLPDPEMKRQAYGLWMSVVDNLQRGLDVAVIASAPSKATPAEQPPKRKPLAAK